MRAFQELSTALSKQEDTMSVESKILRSEESVMALSLNWLSLPQKPYSLETLTSLG